MILVFRWDGKELLVNPATIMAVEKMDDYTKVTFIDGKDVSLSITSYDLLSGYVNPKIQRPGFEI